jgi:hypothetical protein
MSFRVQDCRVFYAERPVFTGPAPLTLLDATADTALLLIDTRRGMPGQILKIDREGQALWRLAHPFGDDLAFLDAACVDGGWYAYREDAMCYAFDPATGRIDIHSARLVM